MKDYWNDLKINECWSPRQKFNKVMDFINENLNTPITENTEIPLEEEEIISTGNVQVSVIDDEDEKVSNVNVTLSANNEEYTGTTGTAGGCTIRDVPYGEYDVVAVKEGYVTVEDSIVVNDTTVNLNIVLSLVPTVEEEETEG